MDDAKGRRPRPWIAGVEALEGRAMQAVSLGGAGAVMLNPQPLPPRFSYVLLNPQPLPPRYTTFSGLYA